MYEEDKQNAIMIAHGDLDGVVSAVMLYRIYKQWNIETVYSQPYWLTNSRFVGDLSVYDKIIIADIALNNRDKNLGKTIRFISKYPNKILWYDHHHGWSLEGGKLSMIKGLMLFVDDKYDSCVSLIQRKHKDKYPSKVNGLIKLAHLTDTAQNLDNEFHKALKINPKNNETRNEIFNYGISIEGGELERQSLNSIQRKARYYDNTMKPNTMNVLKNDSKRMGKVLFVDITERENIPIDKTLLFFEAYEETPYVCLKFRTKDGQPCCTIGRDTDKTHTNLIKLFKQRSGQNYRITLYKPKYTDKQIAKILNKH